MSGSGMDVDEEGSEIFERGLKSETVFSKSKEMTVSFYAQLPVEVRQALRNAGEKSFQTPFDLASYVGRLLQGRIHRRCRPSYWFCCGRFTGDMFRVEVQSGAFHTPCARTYP